MKQPRSTTNYGMDWGPYADQAQATFCLSQFTDAGLGEDFGIIYCDSDAACLIRRPVYGVDGTGYSLIAQSFGPLTPNEPPEPALGFMQRVEHFFGNALAQLGRNEERQADMQMAAGQSITQWLANPVTEHELGLAVDILGMVSFAFLFLPGIGEAEMGIFATARVAAAAGNTLKVMGYGTAGLAFAGSVAGFVSDGGYVYFTYGGDPDVRMKADEWAETGYVKILSAASAILVLPDLPVGGVLLIRDLPEMAAEAAKTAAEAGTKAATSGKLESVANYLDTIAPSLGKNLAQNAAKASSYTKETAREFAKSAADLERESQVHYRKLYATMLINGTATFVGSPMTEAYFGYDNRQDLGARLAEAEHWIGDLLNPPNAAGSRKHDSLHNLGLRIGASRKRTR